MLVIISGIYFAGPCPRGTMGWGRVCYDCPTGRYGEGQPDLDESSHKERTCSECKPGLYSPIPRLPGCLSCPQGRYQDTAGKDQCKPCTAGGYTTTTNVTLGFTKQAPNTNCRFCGVGTFATSEVASTCTKCPKGKSNPTKTNTQYDCEKCVPGYYQPTTGQEKCLQCEAGLYAAKPGQTSCEKCPRGYSGGEDKEGRASC